MTPEKMILVFIIYLIGFLVMFKLSMIMLFNTTGVGKNNIKIIDGMLSPNSGGVSYTQNPNDEHSKTILRSVNEDDGIEFTWSLWLNLNDSINKTEIYHIFNKGQSQFKDDNYAKSNCPGLYLGTVQHGKNKNVERSLQFVIDVLDESELTEVINIIGIPNKKWSHIVIRCSGQYMDIYINGIIKERRTFKTITKQNYGTINVAQHGNNTTTLNGYISNLEYFNYALGSSSINSIMKAGPNTNAVSGSSFNQLENTPNYLAHEFYGF
jgi:hypothetical protein